MNGFRNFGLRHGGPIWLGAAGEETYIITPSEVRRWETLFTPVTPTQRQVDSAVKIAKHRAQDEARRQAEQGRSRERMARDSQERQREAERARLRDVQAVQAMQRTKQQQREQEQRIREEVQLEFQEMLERNKRMNFEMQRRLRENQRDGTWLGTALAGMVPPGFRRYSMRRPLEDTMLSVQGKELIFAQAERNAMLIKLAMEDFNFWVMEATKVACAVVGAPAGYIGTVGMTLAKQSLFLLKQPIANFLNRQISSSSARLVSNVGGKSTDQVLMGCRDEAARIAMKLFRQDVAASVKDKPQQYGNIIDAIFKSLVQHAKRDRLLPQTIRTAPPPKMLIEKTPLQRAADVWDSATGVAWDVFPASQRYLVRHERRYVGGIMPDGTELRELRPLMYQPRPKDWK